MKIGKRLFYIQNKILQQHNPGEEDSGSADLESEGFSRTNLGKFQVYHNSSDKIDPFKEIIYGSHN